MALFWSKKPKAEKNYEGEARKTTVAKAKQAKSPAAKEAKKAVVAKAAPVQAPLGKFSDSAGVIIRPHITEKSGVLSQSGVYTFEVSKNATKATIAKAAKILYKVNPVKVSIINLPAKNVFVKGRIGVVSGTRKALITVKKGEKIDFV